MRIAAVLLSIGCVGGMVTGAEASSDRRPPKNETLAWYNDHWINLASSWETATACHIAETDAVCFATEAELDEYLAQATLSTATPTGPVAAALSCSSSLRLYDGTSYTGSVLSIYIQGLVVNLSGYSFDNKTSSYKVGACWSIFNSAANGGGSTYPTNLTEAGDQSPTMLSGWNNVVSSVYLG
ncbi:MAG: hypothetical protein K8R99_01150 [Actinomycetia bacterium]|nr:hypothetical protein [Actinomycetes bacterium]